MFSWRRCHHQPRLIAAVAIALGVDVALDALAPAPPDDAARDAFSSVVQAPLVEEFAKGLGVFLVFVFGRRAFDGPVDGVVYGALVGAGFAFTENILYFATSLIEGGLSETAFTFVLRGILSPFAHVMFTAVTGYAIGRAARAGATSAPASAAPSPRAPRCSPEPATAPDKVPPLTRCRTGRNSAPGAAAMPA